MTKKTVSGSARRIMKKSTGSALKNFPDVFTFNIPGISLSQNQLDGKHWTVKHQQRDYWHSMVSFVARKCPFNPRRAHIVFTRYSPRLIDPLNVPAGLKWILDGFVEQGWLTGDSYKDITYEIEQKKCEKGKEKVTVLIDYNTGKQ